MNKTMKILLPIAGAAAAAAALTIFAVAPGKAPEGVKAPFMRRNFAHRGLHKLDKSVPENSLAAFRAAAEAGYGIELDVHITSDEQIVVFHDDELKRMCGVEGKLEEMSFEQLSGLRLAQTGERIPLLSEVLEVVDGRTPIIIELKTGVNNELLCEKMLVLMDEYPGRTCIESFDPTIVGWFRRNAPDILRGQLACPPGKYGESTSKPLAFLLGNLLTNFIGRPHFVAYRIGEKPLTVRLCEAMGAMRVAWTSHETYNQKNNDAVIFEYYRPAREY